MGTLDGYAGYANVTALLRFIRRLHRGYSYIGSRLLYMRARARA